MANSATQQHSKLTVGPYRLDTRAVACKIIRMKCQVKTQSYLVATFGE